MVTQGFEETTSTRDFQVRFQGLRTAARLEHPGNDLDDVTGEAVVLAPGLASPELAYLRHHLALLGHAAISFEQPRKLWTLGWQPSDVAELRAGVLEKIILQVEEEYQLGQTALACHSLGALDGAKVSGRIGEVLSRVEHVAGAGFSGDGFNEVAIRLGRGVAAELSPGSLPTMLRSARHVTSNLHQIYLEGVYGSGTDIRPAIEAQVKDGLNIGSLQFERDAVFMPKTVTERMAGLAIRKVVTNTGETIHGCHTSPFDDPEGTAKVLHGIFNGRVGPDVPPRLQAA